MTKRKLRDYQYRAVQLVRHHLEEGDHRLYVCLPTGTGKSVLLSALAAHAITKGRVLVLTHLQDLVLQLAETLRQAGFHVGLLMQGYQQIDRPVVVATPQSLQASLSAFLESSDLPVATVLIDEAHHAVEDSAYEQILTALDASYAPKQVAAIGFTATPYRTDSKSMLSLLPTCAFVREIPEMIQAGWLAPLTWVPLALDIDLAALPTTSQMGELEYAERALTQTLIRPTLMEEIVQRVIPHLQARPTLVFAVSVEHAEQLASLFVQAGCSAVAVSGRSSQSQRERIYAEWRAGNIQIVCNCSLLTEGFDFPEIAALEIARPTRSPGFYVQMLGRGMRKAPGKQDCLVIDVVGNYPDSSRQIVLPHIVGVNRQEDLQVLTDQQAPARDPAEALLRQMMGPRVQIGLTILDPIGTSPYRWGSAHGAYFTMVSSDVAAILERDPKGSGLYHSRLYTMVPGEDPIHEWIEPTYLPLRQQVALVHEATGKQYYRPLGSKEAPWVNDPATDKQVTALKHLYPELKEQIDSTPWTKGTASEVITYRTLRSTLLHPPSPDA